MEKKQNQEIGPRLLPLSFCFLMLALSGILFGIYTFRQISWLKTQIHLQQKVIGTLQSGNGAQRVQEASSNPGSETARVRRNAPEVCSCHG
ncbi:unnamed protein product [Porites evermanni]|uniref:Uncharacterized protein n=2 Tax=Porites TaxID=46719 RepID=A0ABN8SW42_9CNID|nr:unnamed protein product [Porites evermanni]